MRLPDFMIIGAAKSGTTTLYRYLNLHPQIYMSTPKEPAYFARSEVYEKGLDWYSSLFTDAKPEQICGEASTAYTHQTTHKPEIPKLIKNVIPNVKIIYIMRHPVDRAYSNYLQQIKAFQLKHRRAGLPPFEVPETFEQLLARGNSVVDMDDYMEKIDVVAVSKYIEQITLYLQYFPSEAFLFLLFEDLCQKPRETLIKVCGFLNIDNHIDLWEKFNIIANKSSDHSQWYIRERITEKIKSVSILKNTYKLFPQKFRDLAYYMLEKVSNNKQLSRKYLPQLMLPETYVKLSEEFREVNAQLAEFLQRDLSHWNK